MRKLKGIKVKIFQKLNSQSAGGFTHFSCKTQGTVGSISYYTSSVSVDTSDDVLHCDHNEKKNRRSIFVHVHHNSFLMYSCFDLEIIFGLVTSYLFVHRSRLARRWLLAICCNSRMMLGVVVARGRWRPLVAIAVTLARWIQQKFV